MEKGFNWYALAHAQKLLKYDVHNTVDWAQACMYTSCTASNEDELRYFFKHYFKLIFRLIVVY